MGGSSQIKYVKDTRLQYILTYIWSENFVDKSASSESCNLLKNLYKYSFGGGGDQ